MNEKWCASVGLILQLYSGHGRNLDRITGYPEVSRSCVISYLQVNVAL
jgi:hypothetical protein